MEKVKEKKKKKKRKGRHFDNESLKSNRDAPDQREGKRKKKRRRIPLVSKLRSKKGKERTRPP
jgi:hypothetical protein